MDKILVTAVGTTDPLSGGYDGGMLHIIRKYKPEKIYAVVSSEMKAYEDKDSRYSKGIEYISEYLNYMPQVRLIIKDDYVDVHKFDEALNIFDGILHEVIEENPEGEIIINISSGTPAIKNALFTLANTSDRLIKPVQVSNPDKKSGNGIERTDYKTNYDFELLWELNEDNNENYIDRTEEIKAVYYIAKNNKNIIENHLRKYDYFAAMQVAEKMTSFLDEKTINLIKTAYYRSILDKNNCRLYEKKSDYDIYPIKVNKHSNIFEYLLMLDLKAKRHDYLGFIAGITPAFFEILHEILDYNYGFNHLEYLFQESGGRKVNWDYNLLGKNSTIMKNEYFHDAIIKIKDRGESRAQMVNSNQLINVLEAYGFYTENIGASKDIDELRKVEKAIRNEVAHTITFVDEDKMKKIGLSTKDVLKTLKNLLRYGNININKEYWNSYDDLNEEIIKRMNRDI